MIAPLTNDTVLWLAVIAGLTLYGVVSVVARAFGADEVDEDEIAERIETAIRDATSDLLDALTEANASLDRIVESNAYLEESERDYNQREGYADEAPGTSLHELFVDEPNLADWQNIDVRKWTHALRPRGFWSAETTPPYAGSSDLPVDLRKPEDA
jgi:enamine deaminase RidA (YjgF/YER057c/UK114 family)